MTKNLKLTYIGPADFGGDIYQDQNGRYFQDVESDPKNPTFYTMAGGIDGEPANYIGDGATVELINPPNHPTSEERFNYMMLSRLQADCEYFLGNGGRNSSRLWAGNVFDQINEMLKIYNWFDDDKKPDWITPEVIYNYEIAMTNKEDK